MVKKRVSDRECAMVLWNKGYFKKAVSPEDLVYMAYKAGRKGICKR